MYSLLFVYSYGYSNQAEQQYYLDRNPTALTVLLGKLFVFSFTWSFGGCFSRQDDMDDDAGIGRKGGDKKDFVEVDVAYEFDNFMHEVFETEPPLGE
jgi:dynein heavy chain